MRNVPESSDPGSPIHASTCSGDVPLSNEGRGRGGSPEALAGDALPGEALETLLDDLIAHAAHAAARDIESGAADLRAGDVLPARDGSSSPRPPCVVIVDGDADLRAALSGCLGAACQTHEVDPSSAVGLLQGLTAVDVALVDCDQPPSAQAPIFRELARWPSAICVLMSANAQKLEQLRALGVFAPLVLDKPLRREALEAIRSATLELAVPGW
jgi:CheY-like chemotaxis protein